jgi:fatty acid-binding protein DegV
MNVIARVHDLDAAVDAMAEYVRDRAGSTPQLVGVGHAGAGELADALAARLTDPAGGPVVRELVRYTVGPSVGAHTGAGTAGCVFLPAS